MIKQSLKILLAGTVLSTVAVSANAQDNMDKAERTPTEKAAQVIAEPMAILPVDAYVTVTGKVGEISDDEFVLDLKSKDIVVELDRFGWGENATDNLVQGESVTVKGFIDDDFLEGREIEAYEILMNDSYVYYYTTETVPTYTYENLDGALVSMSGVVSDINGREFTLKNGTATMKVDTADMAYNPLDSDGLQQIENGDMIYVFGDYDANIFEEDEIAATGVVEYVKR